MTNKKTTTLRRSVLTGGLTLGAATAVPSTFYSNHAWSQNTMRDGGALDAAAETSENNAAISAAAAPLYNVQSVDSVAAVTTDTVLTYTAGQSGTVAAGDHIKTRKEGFTYRVAASGASDEHLTTAGGVKLYVLPGEEGYNVIAFGTVGDGVADDTVQIQAAIAAAVAGQEIYFPTGTYLITDTLTMDKQLSLLGDGWNGSVLLFNAPGLPGIEWTAQPMGSKISGLKITSALLSTSLTNEVGIKGREDGSNRNLVIDRCYISEFSLFGIMLHLGWNCHVQNNEIRNCGNATNGGGGIVFYDFGGSQIGSTGHLIENNYIAGCYNGICSGSVVAGYSGYAWNNTFINNIYEYNDYPVNFVNGGRQTYIKHYQENNTNESVLNGGVIIDFISAGTGTQVTWPANAIVLDKDKTIIHAFKTDDVDYSIKPNNKVGAQIGTGPSGTPHVRGTDKLIWGTDGYEWDGTVVSVNIGYDPGGDTNKTPGFASIATDSSPAAGSLYGQFMSCSRDASGAGQGSKGGIKVKAIGTDGDSRVVICTSSTSVNEIEQVNINASGSVYPENDNVSNLGAGSNRWGVVYAATGTINTSDANAKQDIKEMDAAEKAVAKSIKSLFRTYKFKDAVSSKGDKARKHFGVMAQEVEQAFIDAGLDASEYGLFCRDFYYTYNGEVVEVDENKMFTTLRFELNGEPVFKDEKGELPEGFDRIEVKNPTIEHERLGIRYEELLAFVISAI